MTDFDVESMSGESSGENDSDLEVSFQFKLWIVSIKLKFE